MDTVGQYAFGDVRKRSVSRLRTNSPLMSNTHIDLMLPQLSVRVNPENPNHHLWNNNGTWFIHYVVHPTPITKERVRRSLRTKSLQEARAKRDELLESALAA